MSENLGIFLNKKILVYGLGKTGLSTYKFLKYKSNVFLFDDFLFKKKPIYIKKNFLDFKKILK